MSCGFEILEAFSSLSNKMDSVPAREENFRSTANVVEDLALNHEISFMKPKRR